jgi:hypothetical protein
LDDFLAFPARLFGFTDCQLVSSTNYRQVRESRK